MHATKDIIALVVTLLPPVSSVKRDMLVPTALMFLCNVLLEPTNPTTVPQHVRLALRATTVCLLTVTSQPFALLDSTAPMERNMPASSLVRLVLSLMSQA